MCWAEGDKDIDKSAIETVDEVIDVRWLKVAHVYKSGFLKRKINMDIYKKSIYDCYGTWAFKTHKDRIIEMLKMTVNGGKVKLLRMSWTMDIMSGWTLYSMTSRRRSSSR